MKYHLTIIAWTLLLADSATAQTVSPSIDAAIQPLEKPNLSSAKLVVQQLNAYAVSANPSEKAAATEIGKTVQDIFTAEYQVETAKKGCEKAESEAIKEEARADDLLTPNAFGNVNKFAAQQAILKANELRTLAGGKLKAALQGLDTSMRKADALITRFHEQRQVQRVVILHGVLNQFNIRHFPDAPVNLTVTGAAVDRLREFARMEETWLADAQVAEKSGDSESAVRLFTKAHDLEGRKRAATALAQQLEQRKLFGSAIEYYEIGGQFAQAKALREAHPELLEDAFAQLNAEDIYAKASPACVRIVAETASSSGLGSGFFFRQGGYVLTNNHVVKGAESLTVKTSDEKHYEAKVIASSETPDLAVIKVELDEHEVIRFGIADAVKIGANAVLIGFPKVDLATATMNAGRISNTDRVFRGNPCFQLDVSANHGNSGGPVLNSQGRVIGILTFGLGDLDIDRFNFAIRVDTVRSFLSEHLGNDFSRN